MMNSRRKAPPAKAETALAKAEQALAKAEKDLDFIRHTSERAISALENLGRDLTSKETDELFRFRAIITLLSPKAYQLICALSADGPASPDRVLAAVFGPPTSSSHN